MALSDMKTIKTPKGVIFYFAIFLAVFYFFFTTPKSETESGEKENTRRYVR